MSATLPTAAFLAQVSPDLCFRLLSAHAGRLNQCAAHVMARRDERTSCTNREWVEHLRKRRRAAASVRRRLRRLYDRADEFGVDIGQPTRPRPAEPKPLAEVIVTARRYHDAWGDLQKRA